MANVVICDICGKSCGRDASRFTLTETVKVLWKSERDICSNCIQEIKDRVKK